MHLTLTQLADISVPDNIGVDGGNHYVFDTFDISGRRIKENAKKVSNVLLCLPPEIFPPNGKGGMTKNFGVYLSVVFCYTQRWGSTNIWAWFPDNTHSKQDTQNNTSC